MPPLFIMKVLEIEELFKSYRQKDLDLRNLKSVITANPVLKGLSLSIEENEIFGLVGLNGQGKSTTLKLVMGFIFPDRGKIEVLGHTPGHPDAKKRMSFLPENTPLYTTVKVYDIMKFTSFMRLGFEDKDRIVKFLELVNLIEARNKMVRDLSRGMLQRLGLAQAFFAYPDFIILDEPLSGLDPLGRRMAKDLVISAKNRGKTVLFTSHILEDIEEISDRVGIMHQGKIIKYVNREELKTRGSLESIFIELIGNA